MIPPTLADALYLETPGNATSDDYAAAAMEWFAARLDDPALVAHLENWIPLGFRPGRDPYANVTEAARAFLAELKREVIR